MHDVKASLHIFRDGLKSVQQPSNERYLAVDSPVLEMEPCNEIMKYLGLSENEDQLGVG